MNLFFSLVIDQSLETVQILSNFGAMRRMLQTRGTQVSGGNVPMSNPSKPQTVNPLYISMTYAYVILFCKSDKQLTSAMTNQ